MAATPAAGWAVEVEQASGDEIDLDFRRGTVRVQVDVELEDGQVRERVRVRDLGFASESPWLYGETRCDLHPSLSSDGGRIQIDVSDGRTRSVVILRRDVTEIDKHVEPRG